MNKIKTLKSQEASGKEKRMQKEREKKLKLRAELERQLMEEFKLKEEAKANDPVTNT